MAPQQKTTKRDVEISGAGIHTGENVTLKIKPARPFSNDVATEELPHHPQHR